MSLVKAFRIIDDLEDLFRDYRGMNTKDVVKQLRALRIELADEFSRKEELLVGEIVTPFVSEEETKAETPKETADTSSVKTPNYTDKITIDDLRLAMLQESIGFPQFIANLQKIYEIPNKDLADALSVNPATVCNWKNGKAKPLDSVKMRVCKILRERYNIPPEVSRKYLGV